MLKPKSKQKPTAVAQLCDRFTELNVMAAQEKAGYGGGYEVVKYIKTRLLGGSASKQKQGVHLQ